MGKPADLPAVDSDDGFILQREIELFKKPCEYFGITLAIVARRAIITSVRETEMYGSVCPAARVGLSFGDEIVSINGMLASSQCTVQQAAEILNQSRQVKLCVREMPFFRLNTLRRQSGTPVGLCIEDGIIAKVEEGSAAAECGLKPNAAIVAINGECVIGRSDNHVTNLLSRGWCNANNELVVTTMSARKYKDLKAAVLQMPSSSRPSITSLTSNVVPSPEMARRNRASIATTTTPPLPRRSITPAPGSPLPRHSVAGMLPRHSAFTAPLSPRRSEPAANFFSAPSSAGDVTERSSKEPVARTLSRHSLASALRRMSSTEFANASSTEPGSPPLSPKAIYRSLRSLATAA